MFGSLLKNVKTFFAWKNSLLSKNLCFQQPRARYRNDLITSTLFVSTPSGSS